MRPEGQIDYMEFPGVNLSRIKRFYNQAFGWEFQDLSPNYVSFAGDSVGGGFSSNPGAAPLKPRAVLYASNLEAMERRVRMAGGLITREIYEYPGGRRFHFLDPSANELGVWSDGSRRAEAVAGPRRVWTGLDWLRDGLGRDGDLALAA